MPAALHGVFAGADLPVRAADLRTDLQAFLWPRPDTRVRDQWARALEPARLRDKVVVVTFVSTGCSAVCVARLLALEEAGRELPPAVAERTAFLAIGTDPLRDDPPALARLAAGLGIEAARWTMLVGDAATLADQLTRVRYPRRTNPQPDPPGTIVVFDRTGQTAMAYGGEPLDRARLVRDLTLLESFEQGVGHPPRQATSESLPLGRTH